MLRQRLSSNALVFTDFHWGTIHLDEESASRQLCSFISTESPFYVQVDWIYKHWPTARYKSGSAVKPLKPKSRTPAVDGQSDEHTFLKAAVLRRRKGANHLAPPLTFIGLPLDQSFPPLIPCDSRRSCRSPLQSGYRWG